VTAQQKRLGRLAIALLAAWVICWSAVYVVNFRIARILGSDAADASACAAGFCDSIVVAVVSEKGVSPAEVKQEIEASVQGTRRLRARARQWMTLSLWLGICGVVVTPLAFLSAHWARRSFADPRD
jgi:hypothetical protein